MLAPTTATQTAVNAFLVNAGPTTLIRLSVTNNAAGLIYVVAYDFAALGFPAFSGGMLLTPENLTPPIPPIGLTQVPAGQTLLMSVGATGLRFQAGLCLQFQTSISPAVLSTANVNFTSTIA